MCTDRRSLALALILGLGACEAPALVVGDALDITVVADATIEDADLAGVGSLMLEISGAESATLFFDSATPFQARRRKILYYTTARSGEVELAIEARDQEGRRIGTGTARVALAHGTTTATVTLSKSEPAPTTDLGAVDQATPDDLSATPDLAVPDLAMPDLAMPDLAMPDLAMPDLAMPDLAMRDLKMPDLAMRDLAGLDFATPPIVPIDLAGVDGAYVAPLVFGPPTATVFIGGTQAFYASEPVTYSVSSSDGSASVSAGNIFSGATAPGVYTVEATTVRLPVRVVTSTITVKAGALELLAGVLGARGRADNEGLHARFAEVRHIASDGAGKFYVTQQNNGYAMVRQIDGATLKVSTLAGGQYLDLLDGIGEDALFAAPYGAVVDGPYVFVSDEFDQSVRRIEIATRKVTTVAGNGRSGTADGIGSAARFNSPLHLVRDGQGFLYLADDNRVRKINAKNDDPEYGKVTTLPGSPFSWVFGLAYVGPPPGVLYVGDVAQDRIYKVTGLDGTPTYTAWAGFGTSVATDLIDPNGLVVVGNRMFIVGHSRIRAIDIDVDGNAVGVTNLAGAANTAGWVDGPGDMARFNFPQGIDYYNGELYVADYNNYCIRKVNPTTGDTTTWVGRPATTGWRDAPPSPPPLTGFPRAFIPLDNNSVWVADGPTVRLLDFAGNMSTVFGKVGEPINVDGVGAAVRFREPKSFVKVGLDVYVTDSTSNLVRKINTTTNTVTTIAGNYPTGGLGSADGLGVDARFNSPWQLATDGTYLYLTDRGNCTIRRIEISTTQTTTLAGLPMQCGTADGVGSAARFSGPRGMVLDGGALWVADVGRMRRVDLATRRVDTVAGGFRSYGDGTGFFAGFGSIDNMAGDGLGHLFLGDLTNNTVRRYDTAWGTLSTMLGTLKQQGLRPGALPSTVYTPTGIYFFGVDDFLISDTTEHGIVRMR